MRSAWSLGREVPAKEAPRPARRRALRVDAVGLHEVKAGRRARKSREPNNRAAERAAGQMGARDRAWVLPDEEGRA